MKKLIIIVFLLAPVFQVSGQKSWEELKSGKYFRNSKKDLYTGNWVSNEIGKEIEFFVSTKKTRLKSPPYDFSVDALFINIIKYMYNGENIAGKLGKPIRLVGTDMTYFASKKDTITNNDINIKLEVLSRDSLLFTVNTLFSGNSGTVFYPSVILTRKKKK